MMNPNKSGTNIRLDSYIPVSRPVGPTATLNFNRWASKSEVMRQTLMIFSAKRGFTVYKL